MKVVILLCVLVFLLHRIRAWLLDRPIAARNDEPFDGELYQVGKCIVARRAVDAEADKQKTIVCMHGWLEDHRYFSELYSPRDGEILFINSCDYHVPTTSSKPEAASWDNAAAYSCYPEGSIEYDAAVLISTVEALASNSKLVLHGHSRGGAVVLEAVKQKPALFVDAQLVLEAAILPEASIHWGPESPAWLGRLVTATLLFVFPFAAAACAKYGLPATVLKGMGPASTRKALVLTHIFSNPRSVQVLMNNIESIRRWPDENTTALYNLAPGGTILIGSSDSVLSRRKMLQSASRSGDNFRVVETTGSSHFISLDAPDQLRSAIDL